MKYIVFDSNRNNVELLTAVDGRHFAFFPAEKIYTPAFMSEFWLFKFLEEKGCTIESIEERNKVTDEDIVVIATDKNTGYIQTVTVCDRKDASKYAKYYRSVGYNSRIVTREELDSIHKRECKDRMEAERRVHYE